MKEKYVDEKHGFWFEFGRKGSEIDIASSSDTMDVGPVDEKVAKVLMEEHNRVQRKLVEVTLAFAKAAPVHFDEYQYGTPSNEESSSDIED